MKILIDSNIYLDFYRSNNESIKIFEEIIKNSDHIILTDQIIQEFYRNRETILKNILIKFESESKIENFSSEFLKGLSTFSSLLEIQKEFNNQRKKVKDELQVIINDPYKDEVFLKFEELVDKLGGDIFVTDNSIISSARDRKAIGNPPTSSKYSIGDEINWELLLKNSKDDIAIVGRDKTFVDNISFLKLEFNRKTGKLIYGPYMKITDALKTIGVEEEEELLQLENRQIEEIKLFDRFWKGEDFNHKEIIAIICPFCGYDGPTIGEICPQCGLPNTT